MRRDDWRSDGYRRAAMLGRLLVLLALIVGLAAVAVVL